MATFHLSTRAQSRNLYGHKVNSLSHFQYITRSGRYTNREEDLAYSESGNIPNCAELELDIKNYWKAYDLDKHLSLRKFRKAVVAYSLLRKIEVYQACEELCKKYNLTNV